MQKKPIHNRRLICLLQAVLLSLSLSLCSCDVLDKLGFDTYDYMGEEVLCSHSTDSETAAMLTDMLRILIMDSMTLSEFDNMRDAIDLYRDAVLYHMMQTGYAKYSGNVDLIADAAEAYPEYQITQLIPAGEFESTMYRYFGGDVKITHRNGTIFHYLKKVNAYSCNMTPEESGIQPQIFSIEETAKTYRVRFRCALAEEVSKEYFTLIIKRDDGTYYFKKLYST